MCTNEKDKMQKKFVFAFVLSGTKPLSEHEDQGTHRADWTQYVQVKITRKIEFHQNLHRSV